MKLTNVQGVALIHDGDMVVLAQTREGAFEPETFAYFKEALKSNPIGVFVDVGAYTGVYGICAAMRGMTSYFFEPNPLVYQRMMENIELNRCENYKARMVAISDETRMGKINVNPGVLLTSGGSIDETTVNRTRQVDIELIAPNDELDSFPRPDIIKIDVEGHELQVIQGMELILKETRPTVIVEALSEKMVSMIKHKFESMDFEFVGIFDGRNLIFKG